MSATSLVRNRHYMGPSERLLSQTGLYATIATRSLAKDVMPFAPQFALWSDEADKKRYIYIPPGAQIDTSNADRWNFPTGTRLWKEFSVDDRPIETRMLLNTGPRMDEWDMAVYVWREDGADAKKSAFSHENASNTSHDVPGPRACITCHGSTAERRPLGFSSVQLPWEHDSLVSVQSLAVAGRLSDPHTHEPTIPGSPETRAALGYLHANCGSCPYEGSTAVMSSVPLRLALTTAELGEPERTGAYRTSINRAPLVSGLGAHLYVAPSQPEKSLIWQRMRVRDESGWQMPPLATEEVDDVGVAIVGRWISELR